MQYWITLPPNLPPPSPRPQRKRSRPPGPLHAGVLKLHTGLYEVEAAVLKRRAHSSFSAGPRKHGVKGLGGGGERGPRRSADKLTVSHAPWPCRAVRFLGKRLRSSVGFCLFCSSLRWTVCVCMHVCMCMLVCVCVYLSVHACVLHQLAPAHCLEGQDETSQGPRLFFLCPQGVF